MTPEDLPKVRALVQYEPLDDAALVAARAAGEFDRLTRHLSRLVGVQGIHALTARTFYLSAKLFPFLALIRSDNAIEELRRRFELQPVTATIDAFVCVVVTLIEMLERMIGRGLVGRLLQEVWPAQFPDHGEVPK